MPAEPNTFSDSIPSRFPSSWDFVAGLIPLLAVSPALILQAIVLWRTPETRIGLLVALILIVLIGWQAKGSITKHRLRFRLAVVFLLGSAALAAYGVANWSLNLIQLSAIGCFIAWGLGRCSQRHWYEIVGLGCLLSFIIPIPQIYVEADNWLTEFAGQSASVTLDAHGVPNYLDGNKLTLQNGMFWIPMATSAKLGLYAVLCCTGIWCWFKSRSLFHSALLLLAGAGCLVVIRFFAILLVSFGLHRYSADWTTSSTPHYLISFGAFGAILVLLVICDQFMVELLTPIPNSHSSLLPFFAAANNVLRWPMKHTDIEADDTPEYAKFQLSVRRWRESWYTFDWRKSKVTKALCFAACAVYVLLGIPVSIAAIRSGVPSLETPMAEVDLASFREMVKPTLFPSQLGNGKLNLVLVNGKSVDSLETTLSGRGTLFLRAVYEWNGSNAFVELVSPQLSWVSPSKQVATKAVSSTETYSPSLGTENWGYLECHLSNKLSGDTYILQSYLNDDKSMVRRLEEHTEEFAIQQALSGKGPNTPMYELRLIFESGKVLDPDQLNDMRNAFDQIRNHLRSQLPSGQLSASLVVKK
ncbi:MAG: archaeosortase/exosortase family protein [Pirellulales bacterium]